MDSYPLPDPFFDILKTPVTMVIEGEDKKATVKFNTVGKVKEDYSKGYETSEGIIMDIDDVRKITEQMGDKKIKKINYGSVIVKVSHITKVGEVEKKIKSMGYNTSSMESIRKPMEKEAHQKQLMLGGLGAISLFVAALGITNTMIMSISERTKEIGIMKSLGCFIKDIRILFLSEAAAIGFIGGIVGSLISFVVSIVMNLVSSGGVSLQNIIGAIIGGPQVSRMSVIPLWLYLFAILFSVLIGICSGYYPANRAVKIPALEAIKGE